MDNLPDTLERLTARLETLEHRVCALERSSGPPSAIPAMRPATTEAEPPADEAPFAQAAGVFSVLGKAMLGIAGAYLLRAVAEMSSLPRLAVAAVAIAYAALWLVWAARVKAGEWLASTTYACTSALILAPLLWELALRFKLLSAPITAGLLCAFVIAASVLAWKRDLAPVFWVGNVTGSLVALGLSIASHNMLPFIAALLLMAIISELAAGCNHELSVRPLVALAADLGVWALIFIYAGPQEARVDYPQTGTVALLTPGLVLFLIFGASIAFKAVHARRKITLFEAIQSLIALLLGASSLLYFLPGLGAGALGTSCLFLSAASYFAVFFFLDGQAERRNYHFFATWSAALFVAGCFLCLPPFWLAAALAMAAAAATVAGARLDRLTLEIHGLIYLAALAGASGLLTYTFRALAWTLPTAPGSSVFIAALCAVICYTAGRPASAARRRQRLLCLVPAALAVCAAAALLVQILLGLTSLRIAPDVFHVAFIRTLVTCAVALALAFCGSRWQRMELNWIAYATLVFVAAKLVFEDLRHGHMEFIAASIFLYAVTLIAAPRLARLGKKA